MKLKLCYFPTKNPRLTLIKHYSMTMQYYIHLDSTTNKFHSSIPEVFLNKPIVDRIQTTFIAYNKAMHTESYRELNYYKFFQIFMNEYLAPILKENSLDVRFKDRI